MKHIAYANKHFRGLSEGWKTDRGRAYILYGPPDDIERLPMTNFNLGSGSNFDEVEIWLYFESTGAERPNIFSDHYPNMKKFVFADQTGTSHLYVQIYSSVPGEYCDPRVFGNGMRPFN